MAKNELNQFDDKTIERYINRSHPQKSEKDQFSERTTSLELKDLLTQRKRQRDKLLKWLLTLTTSSFALLAVLSLTQMLLRITNFEYKIFDGSEFQVLAVSVFGQIIGVVYIISRSLWDDTNYIDKL